MSKENNKSQEPKGTDVISNIIDWHGMDEQPPEELCMVQDEFGATYKAIPTYYPFKMENGKVIPVEPYWDGGWMIQCEGLESNISGKIVKWSACL